MSLVPNDPLIQALTSVFSPPVIDGIFYFFDKMDEYEKKRRYDDNARRMLENAFRLYEQGLLTKDQLTQIVSLLPETKTVEAQPVEVSPEDIGQLLEKLRQQQQ